MPRDRNGDSGGDAGGSRAIANLPRRVSYPLAGLALAAGAPAGLLLMQRLHRRGEAWQSIRDELARDVVTYVYVAGSTALALALFGGILGRYADRLARLASTDPLTGLLNARAFADRFRQEVARAARYGDPLSVLILDLDGLKRINDQQGHQAGDLALQSSASAIRDELRGVDLGARLGGDEFGVLAPRTDEKEALVLGRRLCALAADRLTAALGRPFTISVGAACFHRSDARSGNMQSLMGFADEALYAAKRLGGNRVHVTQFEIA